MKSISPNYKKSGVNIEAGYQAVNLIKPLVKQTFSKAVLGGLGGFGGLFDLGKMHYKNPVLVSGTDGVGSKLSLAQQLNIHDTIGIDLVAMCVNDIVAQGAKPLFFLDYIATHKTIPKQIAQLVYGMVEGCKQSQCALIGGETAEMPALYTKGHYDLAGFVVGVVEKKNLITGAKVKANDLIIGLPSSGIHSNGYSLVRKILKEKKIKLDKKIPEYQTTLGKLLLTPTQIYAAPTLSLAEKGVLKGVAHITGGGFYENIPRALPNNLGICIFKNALPQQPLFTMLQSWGNITDLEMYHVFNMGIGMIYIVSKTHGDYVLNQLETFQLKAKIIGQVTKVSKGFEWK
ncbi:MAG: phosphoribosylformylglycinamidine cyclo-ligase [Alphaproteobacteria bacterium]|nr:phosphoribosylformylglycinamidine cyclo-ligase [Alphaproteobacteria bacterium]